MSFEKSLSSEFVCGHPLPNGGRCAEKIVWAKPCPVHGSETFEEHPLPARKCECERPLANLSDGEPATCVRCGRQLPDVVQLELRR